MRQTRHAVPILLILFVIIAGGLAIVGLSTSGQARIRYFDETDTALQEPFLTYFEDNGGLEVFGYPLAEPYEREGVTVQPFQHVLLQMSVRGVEPAPIAVALGLGEPTNAAVDPQLAAFYEGVGGASFFGDPVGMPHYEGTTLVQDFENARLVLPEGGSPEFARLGEAYVSVYPPPAVYGAANIRVQGTPSPPPTLQANVSVSQPTIGLDEQQTLYVVVKDESGAPIEGVQALGVLRFDGVEAEIELSPTDATGLTQATFVVPPATPGSQVIVEVNLLYGQMFFTIQTTYVQWW